MTKFSEVYERAIFKFRDYGFNEMVSDFKDAILKNYLLSAIVDSKYAVTEVNLEDFDLQNEQFNNQLSNEVIEILSVGILYYWLTAKTFDSKLLRNKIHKSDYTAYSPANLLDKIKDLRESLYGEYMGKINTYSFRHGGIETLKA